MSDNLSTCCTCGYSWPTGTHGGHSCAEYLLKQNAALSRQLAEKDARIVRLEAALSQYADGDNWKLGRKFDPNATNWQGMRVAREALNPDTEQ